MVYSEKALTIDEQIAHLSSKGLLIEADKARKRLSSVSFHRLSGYWHSFREYDSAGNSWKFRKGSDFDIVWDRYVFDRQLRLLVFDAIERVEVAVRNDLINALAIAQGPFGYLIPTNLPNIQTTNSSGKTVTSHAGFLSHARALYRREIQNGNSTVKEFRNRYGCLDEYLPYWILTEILEFGSLLVLLKGIPNDVKKDLAHKYGLKKPDIFESWMGLLRSARNNCAHHGRFWNRINSVKPELPNKKTPTWHTPVEIETVKDTAFGTLTVLKYLMSYIAPQSKWDERLEALFAAHSDIDRALLGYPENWRDCPIWH